MRGYIIIPESVECKACKYCGARPIIALAAKDEYVVKCPNDDSHYQTQGGMIDIDDWNQQNVPLPEPEFQAAEMVACYDSKLNYTFFLPVA
ncbi:MAG: hypothetical protein ACXVA2_19460 [Mucilaginibacter sp.]